VHSYIMRTRTRTIPGRYPLPDRVFEIFSPIGADHSDLRELTSRPYPPSIGRLMKDEPERAHIFNDVYSSKVETDLYGYLTDPNHNHPMVRYQVTNGAIETPVIGIYDSIRSFLPEWDRPLDVKYWLRRNHYESWVKEKWKGPKPSLSTGFSLPNFLLELGDTKHLLKSWLSKRGLQDRWHALMGRHKTLGDRARALADERLAHVYGTRLFIADVRTLFTILCRWKQNADKFLSNNGKLRRSLKAPIIAHYQTGSVTTPWPLLGVSPSLIGMVTDIDVEFHATLAYTVNVPELKGFLARLAQLSDSFGVRLDAGIVWDAIPYSFVVDWFINMSEWLHSNWSRDWYRMDVKLCEFCHSAKIKETRQLYWYRPYAVNAYDYALLAQRTCTYYKRQRDNPPVFTQTDLDTKHEPWKVGRILNAISLLAQKTKLPGRKYAKA